VDGLVEDLIYRISVIEDLRVISRTSSEKYREKGTKSIPEIASELNVSYVIEGTVQRYGGKARIFVQLIDAVHDDHVWTENYDRKLDDIFSTQSEIAIEVASELNAFLTTEQKSLLREKKTSNIKAFELYQLGRFYWDKRTREDLEQSTIYFNQAIEEDSDYGLAYAGLADAYFIMGFYGWISRLESYEKAVELAYKALELDGNLAEAHAVLATIYHYRDWDWERAEEAYQRALKLNPNYSTAHQYYAEHLAVLGKHDEARMHMNRAVELNPFSFIIRNMSARLYYHQGNFIASLQELEMSDGIEEGHWRTPEYRFLSYWQLGRESEAFESLLTLMSYNPRYDLETAKIIFSESGLKAVFQWSVDLDIAASQENIISSYYMARDLSLLGKDQEVLDWLEKALELHQTRVIRREFSFKDLHDHPRFQAILKEMGLPGGK
jgi:TolB-like protein